LDDTRIIPAPEEAALSPAPSPHRPLRGAVLFVAALFLFACLDTSIKHLSERYEVPFIIAVRYLGNLVLMVALLAPREGVRLVRTRRTGLVAVRAGCLCAASLLVGLSLARIPVAETTAINFLAPILMVLLARPLLGEGIGLTGWIAALGGFAGVLLIVRPGSGLDPAGILFMLGAVCANTAYQLLSRVLVATERTLAMLFHTALMGSVCFGVLLPWSWGGEVPEGWTLALFLCLGVFGGLGHFMLTAAFRHAPASLLAPLNYVQLLWAGLLGWLVFGQVPDGIGLLGMAVVTVAGLLVTLRPRVP